MDDPPDKGVVEREHRRVLREPGHLPIELGFGQPAADVPAQHFPVAETTRSQVGEKTLANVEKVHADGLTGQKILQGFTRCQRRLGRR